MESLDIPFLVCFFSSQRLELSSVDVPNEEAAETVMNRYMEPADLGPGIDPKVPRYIIPSNGGQYIYIVTPSL